MKKILSVVIGLCFCLFQGWAQKSETKVNGKLISASANGSIEQFGEVCLCQLRITT